MTTTTRRRVIAAVLAAVALTACDDSSDTTAVGDPMPIAVDSETGCGPIEHPSLQVASHLVGDAEPPSPYSSVPPTSGWHSPRTPEPGRADETLRDPEIVAALESGLVVVALSPDVEDLDRTLVGDLVHQFRDRLLATTYTADMPSDVALLGWGTLQRCDMVDPAAVTSFVLEQRVDPAGGH